MCLILRCVSAAPRYAGGGAHKSGGDVIVDVKRLRSILTWMAEVPEADMEACMTMEQMGFPVRRGGGEIEYEDQIEDEDEDWRIEGMGRWLASHHGMAEIKRLDLGNLNPSTKVA